VEQFIKHHRDNIMGVLEGFDRVLFRGTLRSIAYPDGLGKFLSAKGVRLKNFKDFVGRCSGQLKAHAQQLAKQHSRPYAHIPSPKVSKESLARDIAERDGIQDGLICVFSCVEPCRSFSIRRRDNRPQLISELRQCNFFYFYYRHPEFGFMHVRLQSWFPFPIQVCINGRSYLQRQLDRNGIGYVKRDNCFLRIQDLGRAQQLLDGLNRRCWIETLQELTQPLNPLLGEQSLLGRRSYYWTIRQSEVATDVMFRDEEALASIYPALCRHVIERHNGGEDVLRFFGKRSTLKFNGEVVTQITRLAEGVRIRHRLGNNTIKMYDKQGSVLRIETTINDPRSFRVFRKAQDAPASWPDWRAMRKGVSDTFRRVEVSAAANRRYLDALAVVGDPTPAHRVLDPISQSVRKRKTRTRGLRPIAPEDARLFRAVLRGQHFLRGFTNGDLQRRLYPAPTEDVLERRRRSNRVGRRLRMLRRHGLIRKIGVRRLYRVTDKGYHAMTLALAIRNATIDRLQEAA
jgi:hypothetical protein